MTLDKNPPAPRPVTRNPTQEHSIHDSWESTQIHVAHQTGVKLPTKPTHHLYQHIGRDDIMRVAKALHCYKKAPRHAAPVPSAPYSVPIGAVSDEDGLENGLWRGLRKPLGEKGLRKGLRRGLRERERPC